MDLERLDTVDTSETRYFKKLRPSPVSLVSPVLSSFYTLKASGWCEVLRESLRIGYISIPRFSVLSLSPSSDDSRYFSSLSDEPYFHSLSPQSRSIKS